MKTARATLLSALLITTATITITHAGASTNYSSIWSLGDSLSDTGRLYSYMSKWHLRWIRKPFGKYYHNGRFTNGKVWTEYLGSGVAGADLPRQNYAWGGAITGSTSGKGLGWISNAFANWMIPSLEEQLDDYMLPAIASSQRQPAGSSPSKDFGPNPLITVWIGGNNFRVPAETAPSSSALGEYHKARRYIAANAPEAIRRIHAALIAKANRVNFETPHTATYYALTVPDISATPKLSALDGKSKAEISSVIRQTNRELKRNLLALGDDLGTDLISGRIVMIDTAAMMAEIMANPADFNLTNVTDSCISSSSGEYIGACSKDVASSYLYWDEFHPTTHVHAQLAKFATDTDRLQQGQPVRLDTPYVANIEWRKQIFGGEISGPGRLIKRGEATLTLAGENSYTGGSRFDEGSIRIFKAGALGSPQGDLVFRGGALRASGTLTLEHRVRLEPPANGDDSTSGVFVVDRGHTATLAGPMLSGNGNLAKDGPGALDIRSPIETSRARTDIFDGRLLINSPDVYESDVIVIRNGATLGGAGRVKGSIQNKGNLLTTSSGGSLRVCGAFDQAPDSTIVVPTGKRQVRTGDELPRASVHVQRRIRLAGTVRAQIRNEKFMCSRRKVIQSDEAITGSFEKAETTSPFVDIGLEQDPTTVTATLTRDFSLPSATANQRAVGAYLNSIYEEGDQGDLDRVHLALDLAGSGDGGRQALDMLSGSSLGEADRAIATHGSAVQRQLLDIAAASRRRRTGPGQPQAGARQIGDITLRAQMSAQSWRGRRQDGSGEDAVMSAAIEKAWHASPATTLTTGAAISYGQINASWKHDLRGLDANTTHVAGYATLASGRFFADLAAGVGWSRGKARRTLGFGDFSGATEAHHDATSLFGLARAGLNLDLATLRVEPSIGLELGRMVRRQLHEAGAGAASIEAACRAATTLSPTLGLDISKRLDFRGLTIEPAAWAHLHLGRIRYDRMRHNLAGAKWAHFTLEEPSASGQPGHAMGARIAISAGSAPDPTLRLFAAWEHAQGEDRAAHTYTAGFCTTF